MKRIEAIIRPEKVEAVRSALDKSGYPGIMITEVQGHGKQKGVEQQWRGERYKVEFLSKVKIDIVAKDADVDRIVATISQAAKTGAVGDGKIFVSDVKDAVRIRTGEHGDKAVE